jgi:hypothetical protein
LAAKAKECLCISCGRNISGQTFGAFPFIFN